jgi:hypothetical protein
MLTPTTLRRSLAAASLTALAGAAACAADAPTAPAASPHLHAALAATAEAEPSRVMSDADLATVRAVTARYHRVEAAEADGFVSTQTCVAIPGAGMGVHYVHGARIGDGVLDAARPEVLVYEPQAGGRLRLVAVEYMVPRPMWDAALPGRPSRALRPRLRGRADGQLRPARLGVAAQRGRHLRRVQPGRALPGPTGASPERLTLRRRGLSGAAPPPTPPLRDPTMPRTPARSRAVARLSAVVARALD